MSLGEINNWSKTKKSPSATGIKTQKMTQEGHGVTLYPSTSSPSPTLYLTVTQGKSSLLFPALREPKLQQPAAQPTENPTSQKHRTLMTVFTGNILWTVLTHGGMS